MSDSTVHQMGHFELEQRENQTHTMFIRVNDVRVRVDIIRGEMIFTASSTSQLVPAESNFVPAFKVRAL